MVTDRKMTGRFRANNCAIVLLFTLIYDSYFEGINFEIFQNYLLLSAVINSTVFGLFCTHLPACKVLTVKCLGSFFTHTYLRVMYELHSL